MIKANIPADVTKYLSVFMALSQFDCLPHEELNGFLFTFTDPGYVRPEQSRSGYGDNNYVLNSGSVFWFLVAYITSFITVKLILRFSKKAHEKKIFEKLKAFLFYGFFIGLVVKGYLEFAFSAFFQARAFYDGEKTFKDMWNYDGEAIGGIFAFLTLVRLLIINF